MHQPGKVYVLVASLDEVLAHRDAFNRRRSEVEELADQFGSQSLGEINSGWPLKELAATDIQLAWRTHVFKRDLVLVTFFVEHAAFFMHEQQDDGSVLQTRRLVLPEYGTHSQEFNYYITTIGDVFDLLIGRLGLGNEDTHYLKTPGGRRITDSNETLSQANKGRSIEWSDANEEYSLNCAKIQHGDAGVIWGYGVVSTSSLSRRRALASSQGTVTSCFEASPEGMSSPTRARTTRKPGC